MALANLKILFSMSSDQLRSSMKDLQGLVKDRVKQIETLGKIMEKLPGTSGDAFRAPTGRGTETVFSGPAEAAAAYKNVVEELSNSLGAFQNAIFNATTPLRTQADLALLASKNIMQQTLETRALTAQTSLMVPALSGTAAMGMAATRTLAAMRTQVTPLANALAFFNIVNYDTRAAIDSWNTIAVFRGPGVFVQAMDRMKQSLFGLVPPMRLVQWAIKTLVIPVIATLSNSLLGLANNPAAQVLSANLQKIAQDLTILGNPYFNTTFVKLATAMKLLGYGSVAAAKGLFQFSGIPQLNRAFTQTAEAIRDANRAATQGKTGFQAFFAALKATTLTIVQQAAMGVAQSFRSMAQPLMYATQAMLVLGTRAATSTVSGLYSVAKSAAVATARILTLGMAFRKTGKDSTNAVSGMSKWKMLPAFLSPSLGILTSFGAAFGGIYAIVKGAMVGVSSAIQTEQEKITFGVLLGSVDEAEKRLEELSAFSAKTPFQLPQIIEANKILQTFGGSALASAQVMTMVGDMAAAAGKPINEVADKVGKMVAAFKAGKPFGEAAAELRRMGLLTPEVEKQLEDLRKKGASANEMFAAFAGGMGRFSGVMEQQSQSIGGLFSTLKDNVVLVFRDMMAGVMEAFNVKGALSGLISFMQAIRGNIVPAITGAVGKLRDTVGPIFAWFGEYLSTILPYAASVAMTFASTLFDAFKYVYDTVVWVASAAFGWIANFIGGEWNSSITDTFNGIVGFIVDALLTLEYAITHWKDVLWLAAVGATLGVVTFANQVIHWFTVALPEYLAWFGRNWREIFTDIFNFTTTVFSNMWTNITSFFTELWDWIASGGQDAFQFTWTPLTEGFKATMEALPKIAERQIGPLEQALSTEFNNSATSLTNGLEAFIAERKKTIEDTRKAFQEIAPQPDTTGGLPDLGGGPGQQQKGAKRDVGVSALERGSQAALEATLRAQDPGKDPARREAKEAQDQRKKTNETLASIDKKLGGSGIVLAEAALV